MKTARMCHCLSALGQAVPRQSHLRPSQRQEHCFCEDSEAVAHLPFQRYSLRENDPHVTGIGRKAASWDLNDGRRRWRVKHRRADAQCL